MAPAADPRHGLRWEDTIFGSNPAWKVEPSPDAVANVAYCHLSLRPEEVSGASTSLAFQGAFNKLYAIECPKGSFFMRVTLPVDPTFKNLSETATLEYLRDSTSIRVPKIIASDASRNNEIGFEYVLMERIPGQPLQDVWQSLEWNAKVALVEEVANIASQMQTLQFDHIGSLFNAQALAEHVGERSGTSGTDDTFTIDRVVSMAFFWKTRYSLNVPRGPFKSTREWMEVRMQLVQNDISNVLDDANADEDDIDVMEKAQPLLDRLRTHFENIFPHADGEVFTLYHDDISRSNLVVSPEGKLQALVDWECVSTVPSWKASQFPKIIDETPREVPPDEATYTDHETGEASELYYEHKDEYECTQLRRIFADAMGAEWSLQHEQTEVRRDFEQAMEYCIVEFSQGGVKRWLDHLEQGGDYYSLQRAYNDW